jgi:hypothetical protein
MVRINGMEAKEGQTSFRANIVSLVQSNTVGIESDLDRCIGSRYSTTKI